LSRRRVLEQMHFKRSGHTCPRTDSPGRKQVQESPALVFGVPTFGREKHERIES
jgi:hypothetical protein